VWQGQSQQQQQQQMNLKVTSENDYKCTFGQSHLETCVARSKPTTATTTDEPESNKRK
jgi:hypothetical protein